jgi:membrane-associated phospholipid phosphatase
MTSFEWLALVYFALIGAAGLLKAGAVTTARRRGVLYACGAIALIIVACFTLPWPIRAWLPHLYLVLGYWIPAAFVGGTHYHFERWLAQADARLGVHLAGAWRPPATLLELAYLLCYPLVPAAFAAVFARGTSLDVERFWVAVLLAGFACYASLPWLAARPPRLAAAVSDGQPQGVAWLNAAVLGRVSHQLVTFPSGHVAVSLAAALAVARVSPPLGGMLTMVAVMIAVAAVSGRYHYLVDVLLGLLVGALALLATGLVS